MLVEKYDTLWLASVDKLLKTWKREDCFWDDLSWMFDTGVS